jgi:hypothetical protein
MRVDFVGHATLLIRHGDLTLLSDPWWSGPAYRDQWYPYPIPVPERFDLGRVDAVYISHSHEDHLHAPTLREFLKEAPNAEAIIPLRPETQMRDYLRRIGFRRIREVASGSPFRVRKGGASMRLTLLTHIDDSLLGVEAGGEVLLNLNDALHSSRREMIVEYCRILRGRFPQVDYLFCGFGGASYFPNCVHVAGKDDVAVARARERWFLHNFGLIASILQPRFAFPFAAHFVLPDEPNWWISKTRLELEPPSVTLRALLPETSAAFFDLNPGDFVENGIVHVSERLATEPEVVRSTVLSRYGSPPERPALDPASFDQLVADIRARVASRHAPTDFDALIVLTDFPPRAIRLSATPKGLQVETVDRHRTPDRRPRPQVNEPPQQVSEAHQLVNEPTHVMKEPPQVVIETRADLIRSTLRSPFGKELISIGYGAQFHVRSTPDLDAASHNRLLQLLSPTQPRWRQHLRERPRRTLRYLVGDPSMRYAAAQRLLRHAPAPSPDPAPYDMRDWVAAPET